MHVGHATLMRCIDNSFLVIRAPHRKPTNAMATHAHLYERRACSCQKLAILTIAHAIQAMPCHAYLCRVMPCRTTRLPAPCHAMPTAAHPATHAMPCHAMPGADFLHGMPYNAEYLSAHWLIRRYANLANAPCRSMRRDKKWPMPRYGARILRDVSPCRVLPLACIPMPTHAY